MELEVEKTVSYWLESAKYDLDASRSLIAIEKFPYALFLGHLALEKLLKSLVVKRTEEHAPFTHSLVFLAEKTGMEIPEALLDQLGEFTEFNIEARYPDETGEFYKKCTSDFTKQKFEEIEEAFQWFLQRL